MHVNNCALKFNDSISAPMHLSRSWAHWTAGSHPRSELVYDVLFDLYAGGHQVGARKFLDAYPGLMVSGDGECKTGGYAPGFIEAWLEKRLEAGAIVDDGDGARLSARHRAAVKAELDRYE